MVLLMSRQAWSLPLHLQVQLRPPSARLKLPQTALPGTRCVMHATAHAAPAQEQ
jgi:hypothetical protein